MSLLKRLMKKKGNDEGSALVLVIIAIAFVGTLVAMLVYLVYFNYLMKFTDRAAKNNFYTAEQALDVIHAGLQKDVSKAMSSAYYKVSSEAMNNSTQNDRQVAFEAEFQDIFKHLTDSTSTQLMANQTVGADSMWVYNPDYLKNYWTLEAGMPIYDASAGTFGAKMETNVYSGESKADTRASGPYADFTGNIINFYNVKVSFINEDGYVSIISTDIQIEIPKVDFVDNIDRPKLEKYSLVAGKGIYDGYTRDDTTFEPVADLAGARGSDVEVTGDIFGGDDGIFSNGKTAKITFTQKAGGATTNLLTAGSINAIQGRTNADGNNPASRSNIEVQNNYKVFAGNLYAESATMQIKTDCYIQDDLTTDGVAPKVVIGDDTAGAESRYIGFGTADRSAEGSSAILINGARSVIDLSHVTKLELADHAYVGARHYNANSGTRSQVNGDYIGDIDTYLKDLDDAEKQAAGVVPEKEDQVEERNEKDIMMGQSLAVKSDQIMYMVPNECMCYDGQTQLLAKNPLTYSEYKQFNEYEPLTDANGNKVIGSDGKVVMSNRKRYDVVNTDVIMKKVGGSLSTYNAGIIPVFRRINGDILVYYYIGFSNTDSANKFFRAYYENNKDDFTRYLDKYVASFQLNPAVVSHTNGELSMGGYLIRKVGTDYQLINETYTGEVATNTYNTIKDERKKYTSRYYNLSKNLIDKEDGYDAGQGSGNAFLNVTEKQNKFDSLIGSERDGLGTYDARVKEFKDSTGTVVALVVNNPEKSLYTFTGPDTVKLVIATGDVLVDKENFEGLILSGKNIYIGDDCKKIDYDYSEVPNAMKAKSDDGHFAYEFIRNGIAYADLSAGTTIDTEVTLEEQREADVVKASELVRFVNWNKE